MMDDIKIRGATAESLADVGPRLHHLVASYMTDPGASGGHWYGSGIGYKSLVIYRCAGWWVEMWRTKTQIVVFITSKVTA